MISFLMRGHVLEYLLFVAGFVVFYYGVRELREARRDVDFIDRHKLNGDRKISATFFERNGWVRVIKSVIMMIGGFVCIVLEPGRSVPMPSQSILLLVLLLMLGICLIYLSITTSGTRRLLRRHRDSSPQAVLGEPSQARRRDDPPGAGGYV